MPMGNPAWIRNGRRCLAICLLLFITTGCWDRQEIEERAVVLGIGIDEAAPGAEKEDEEISHREGELPVPGKSMIHVTAQIAVPGRIPLGPGGSGGGGGGGGGGINTVWVVDSVGHTIDDALNNLQQRVAPPLFFGHLRIIVVSESLAKKGIQNLNDYFRRNPDIRRMNWMFVSKGEAKKVMTASPQLERVPTLYLMTTMDQSVKMGRFPNDFLGIFWSSLSAKGREGYLPYAEVKQKDKIQISGLAYFQGDKMVGTASALDIQLYMGLTGMNPSGGQAYTQVPGTEEIVEYSGRSRKALTKVTIENGRPRIRIKIYLEGNLREKLNEKVTLSHEVIVKAQEQLAKDSKKAYEDLIRRTQEKGADIFGFGEHVRAKEWKYWNQHIRTKENWQEMYKNINVDVQVQIHLRRVGMKAT